MTVVGTVCYLRWDGKVLLQKKSEGLFGGGKWNAPGGKIRPDESPERCAVREVLEETGLEVGPLHYHGPLTFYFGETSQPSFIVHVFSAASFTGRLRDSAEGLVRWFPEDHLPYDAMWPDDRYWLPHLLAERDFQGTFYFDEGAENLLRQEVRLR